MYCLTASVREAAEPPGSGCLAASRRQSVGRAQPVRVVGEHGDMMMCEAWAKPCFRTPVFIVCAHHLPALPSTATSSRAVFTSSSIMAAATLFKGGEVRRQGNTSFHLYVWASFNSIPKFPQKLNFELIEIGAPSPFSRHKPANLKRYEC